MNEHDSSHRRAALTDAQRARLAARMAGAASGVSTASKASAPVRSELQTLRPRVAPLSPSQRRLWFLWQLDPSDTAYHLHALLRFEGVLDAAALASSLRGLVARHEALRTVIEREADGEPRQRVLPFAPERLDHAELVAADDADARALAESLKAQPFDLATGPLLRTRLISTGAGRWSLAIVLHHIVSDAWTKRLILAEFASSYAAACRGAGQGLNPGTAAPRQYLEHAFDQARWFAGPAPQRLLDAALRRLTEGTDPAERPERLLAPDVDFTDAAADSIAIDRSAGITTLVLDRALADALRARAHAAGTGLGAGLLTGFAVALARRGQSGDLRIAMPVAGRHRGAVDEVVGCFVDTMLVRCRIDARASLAEALADCRDAALAAQEQQDLPFERLVEALVAVEGGRKLPFQVMFNHLREQHGALAVLPGLRLVSYETLSSAPQCELLLDTAELSDGSVRAIFAFDRRRFSAAAITSFAVAWRRALVVLAEAPATALHALELLDAGERARIGRWSDGGAAAMAFGALRPVQAQFAAQAAARPEAIALRCGDRSPSRAELYARVRRLASRLAAAGVGAEARVAIALPRSLELVVALLAVLECGAAYVPLELDYPVDRLRYLLEDCAPALLLTDAASRARLPATAVKILELDERDQLEPLDPLDPGIAAAPHVHPEQAAYAIYTSGSTGRPKGAINRHGALANRIAWMQEAYALDADDVVLQKTPIGFDVSVWEFFWPLAVGARLVLAAPGEHRDPARLVALIEAERVTTLHFVPSMLQVFLSAFETSGARCESLRHIVCSGEALPAELAQRCLVLLPHAALHNLYGPTEAAIDVTHWTCSPTATGPVPIGAPIAGLITRILDAELHAVAPGQPGELYLGGLGLGRGYLGRAALTAERFVADPYSPAGARLYRTGDLARWRADGQIEYLGRLDHQIKLRGQRIELGEIESALLSQDGVAAAVVVARDSALGPQLVAYVVAAPLHRLDGAALRLALATTLSEAMVPASVDVLDALPLSPNGKLDRRALPAPVAAEARAGAEPPRGATELAIAAAWAAVLRAPVSGRDDDFFALGGHSLLATQLLLRLQRLPGGAALTLAQLFEATTVAAQAARFDSAPMAAAGAGADAGAGDGISSAWGDVGSFLDDLSV